MRATVLSLSLLLAASFAPPAQAQAQAGESLRISAGDLLSVHVFREDDLDTKLRVKDAGTVTLPLIGPVKVAGLAAADAAELIAARYRTEGLLKQPQVSVLIEESVAGQVAVLGEVARPGTVPVNSRRSLLDVLAQAGGLLKTADGHVTLRRASGESTQILVANDAAHQLAASNLLVQPGDTVLVPRAGIVYVLGDVGRPGGYLMQDDAQLSLLQALSLAAGPSKTANEQGARLIRKQNGTSVEMPLHLRATERGKTPDLALQNDDIVYVPFSLARNLALGSSTIAASAASAVIYSAW